MRAKLTPDLEALLLALWDKPQEVKAVLALLETGELDVSSAEPAAVDTSDDPEQIIAWITEHCKVVSDQGRGVIPFRLFDYQRDVVRAYETHREVIVLKARQLGMTELTAAYALYKLCHHPRYTVVVLSKGQDEANEFLGKARIAYDHLPAGSKPALVNSTLQSKLLLANGSRMLPMPTTTSAARGYAAQLLILDEWAHQMHQTEVYTAAAPTARSAGNKIIGLSSANGDGNFYARQWHHAVEAQRLGDPDAMHPIFLPWHVRPGRDAAWFKQATAGLEAWQIAQEYPSDASEAFILSGRPRFDVEALGAILAGTQEPTETTSDGGGQLLVWEQPDPTRRYVIGADPAEGLLRGDFSVATVLDVITGTEVAALRGKWEPGTFAGLLNDLGWRYGTVQQGVAIPALLGVEKNNHGHSVLLALRDYPNLYCHQEYDATTGTENARVGWLTSSRSKPVMIDALACAIRERRPYRWRQFLEEALRYVVLDDGKTAASGDYHDDCVTAAAIAEQMRLWVPTQVAVVSMAEELGVGQPLPGVWDPHAPVIPNTSIEVAQMMAEHRGWTIVNDFGRTIDPWSPSGFAGFVDDRY